MPEISRFYGIVITMYFLDHGLPHFHAEYQGRKAKINIETLELIAGSLPLRALNLIREWATLHKDELLENWSRTERPESLRKIDPLP